MAVVKRRVDDAKRGGSVGTLERGERVKYRAGERERKARAGERADERVG